MAKYFCRTCKRPYNSSSENKDFHCPKCGKLLFKYDIEFHEPKQPPQPKCPKCGSTAITSGARGINLTWGMIGASSTVNRCGNCGNTWKPTGK